MDQAPVSQHTVHTPPKITIGLPVHNGGSYLANAIESVLKQTHRDLELIISDNASTDETPEICARYARQDERVSYVRHAKNMGAARNFNYTVDVSRGQYFAWLAHDDLMEPMYLEKCIGALEHEPEAVLCFSKTRFIDESGKVIRDYDYNLAVTADDCVERFQSIVSANHIVVEIFGIIRTDALKQTPKIQSFMTSDIVLLSELLLYGRFIELPEFLFLHREHIARSVLAHAKPRDRERWFDPRRSVRFVFPNWRRMAEHARVVFRVNVSTKMRLQLLYRLAKAAHWRRRILLNELLPGRRD
jgi:glycosyltransferase involved in cell wall biosynthesis